MDSTRLIRIFLSSPGDVADERAIALNVVDELAYDPFIRGKASFEIVAWDKPNADTPMLASLPPQTAIDEGLPMPSDCDIVIVIFWSRMGTPLTHKGIEYLSGTHYEYEKAIEAAHQNGKPQIILYRRSEEVAFKPTDPNFIEKYEQWKKVEDFFASQMDEKGQLLGGYNYYETPEDLRQKLSHHLKDIVAKIISQSEINGVKQNKINSTNIEELRPLWKGSPFPGLHAFTIDDAPIYFGRGVETDALMKRLQYENSRFMAVVGASGSGKSSLVGAGLMSRLAKNAIEGSKDWKWTRFTPDGARSGDPFDAISLALGKTYPISNELLQQLPHEVEVVITQALKNTPAWAELVIFIDQFEELFTLVKPHLVLSFIELLTTISNMSRVRTIITLRADFYASCVRVSRASRFTQNGYFYTVSTQSRSVI